MKEIFIKHKFKYRAPEDLKIQLASVRNFEKLIKLIKTQSESMNPDKYDPLKYRGDAFEWFGEFFFKYFEGDNLFLNTVDYQPTDSNSDYGVDGVAKYTKDLTKTVCIQNKYKSNLSAILSAKEDQLSNFGVNAVARYECELNKKYLIVFTSAKGIAKTTVDGIYQGCISCINGEIISRYVDNNEAFWNCFRETVSKVSTNLP